MDLGLRRPLWGVVYVDVPRNGDPQRGDVATERETPIGTVEHEQPGEKR